MRCVAHPPPVLTPHKGFPWTDPAHRPNTATPSHLQCNFLHSTGHLATLCPGIDPRSLGIFSGASDSSMCPGVDSASKNEYQDIPGGKDGWCVRVTTLPSSCAECLKILEP